MSTIPELRRQPSLGITPAGPPNQTPGPIESEKDINDGKDLEERKADENDNLGVDEPIPWAVKWISLIAVMAMPIGQSAGCHISMV